MRAATDPAQKSQHNSQSTQTRDCRSARPALGPIGRRVGGLVACPRWTSPRLTQPPRPSMRSMSCSCFSRSAIKAGDRIICHMGSRFISSFMVAETLARI